MKRISALVAALFLLLTCCASCGADAPSVTPSGDTQILTLTGSVGQKTETAPSESAPSDLLSTTATPAPTEPRVTPTQVTPTLTETPVTPTPVTPTPTETPVTPTPVTPTPTETPVMQTSVTPTPTETPVTPTPTETPVTPTPVTPTPTETPVTPTPITPTPTETPVTPTPVTPTPTETPVTPTPVTPTPTETPVTPTPVTPTPTETPEPFIPFTIGFTGDVSYAETYYEYSYQRTDAGAGVYNHALAKGRSLNDLIDSAMLDEMRRVDFLVVNCESSVSARGTPLGVTSGKAYSFRTSPETAQMFKSIGADLIGLANNHVYDFGKDAFLDTLDAFENMGLPTFGAGRNAAQAYEPYYYTQSGMTVALIATSCAEKDYYTLVAGENEPGICGCYDTAAVCEKIREAKQKADFVVVYPHFGMEYEPDKISDAQRQASYDFIDAGADLIVGTHAHCLQGIDSYKGKIIFYNLGNFLFNNRELSTMLLELTFVSRDSYTLRVMAGLQTDGTVRARFGVTEAQTTLDYLRKRSFGIAIDQYGYVYDCKVFD